MNTRTRNKLRAAEKAVTQLVGECHKGSPLYAQNAKAVAQVSRTGKWFLRHAYRGRIPDVVLRARKAGFGLPIDHWFRGRLHETAADLLLGADARSRVYLKRDAVAAVLKIHRSGQRNYDEMIWTLLILELWLREIRRGVGREAA